MQMFHGYFIKSSRNPMKPCSALFASFVAIIKWLMFVWSCTAIEVGSIWIDVAFLQIFFSFFHSYFVSHIAIEIDANCQSPVKYSINNSYFVYCVCVLWSRLISFCHWIATCFWVRYFKVISNLNRMNSFIIILLRIVYGVWYRICKQYSMLFILENCYAFSTNHNENGCSLEYWN